ncbi:hypothetical protein NEAUS04_2497 [Nematocida ausubeli]|nr:hypothetical protein NEAUS04_2497 [Nematocida ausubeli]
MVECNVCKLPTKEIDNGYVCNNGHITRHLKEVDEEVDWSQKIKAVKRKERFKLDEVIQLFTARELCAYLGVKYLHDLLKEYEIPSSVFSRYKELYYAFTTVISSKPEFMLNTEYRRITEIFIFLVKRETEEKKGKLYTILDFIRKLDSSDCLFKYYTRARTAVRIKYLRVVPKYSISKITGEGVIRLLQDAFPDKKEYQIGVMGLLTENALKKICLQLGITPTQELTTGYQHFLGTLELIQFVQNRKKFYFSESIIASYIYMYYEARCELSCVKGYVHVLEVPQDLGGKKIMQDFFSRENNISTFKQLNVYMNILEHYNGSREPVFNPVEFPAPEYGRGAISNEVQHKATLRIFDQISSVIGHSSSYMIELQVKLLCAYGRILRRFTAVETKAKKTKKKYRSVRG